MVYQLACSIASLTATLSGKIDAVILTGGLAYSEELIVKPLKKRVGWIAPFYIFLGGDEVAALHEAMLRVINSKEEALDY